MKLEFKLFKAWNKELIGNVGLDNDRASCDFIVKNKDALEWNGMFFDKYTFKKNRYFGKKEI